MDVKECANSEIVIYTGHYSLFSRGRLVFTNSRGYSQTNIVNQLNQYLIKAYRTGNQYLNGYQRYKKAAAKPKVIPTKNPITMSLIKKRPSGQF